MLQERQKKKKKYKIEEGRADGNLIKKETRVKVKKRSVEENK